MNDIAANKPEVRLDVECDPTINFAMQQNDVPVVRQIRITNTGALPLEGVQIKLTSEPELFPAWQATISTIAPGAFYVLRPVDVRLSASLLMGLTERVGGSIHVQAIRGTESLCRYVKPIEMLAFDEWNGLARSLPELLAAYVLPNHPVVEEMLSDAARWLGSNTGDSSLSGYQSRSPKRVGEITQGIFKAIQGRGLRYCNPPASFENTGQKIRLPDRILENRLATCLDLTVLAAACLEQAGLHPLVVLLHGHAFVGVWTLEDCFPDCATDDLLRLRKRVELSEILVFETTLVTSPPPNDFATAVATAKRHLADEQAFQCTIDIHRCRKSRVRPLPVRREGETEATVGSPAHLDSGDAVFDLGEPRSTAEKQAETPKTRLDRWRRKLLDLSLRNKLIHFKETKSTVPLLCPTLGALEDALADGLEFQILPRPEEFGPNTARSAELHRLRTGSDAVGQLLQGEFQSRRLRADLAEQELASRLTGIYRSARTAMEEGGASALYLALGFLSWYETESSEQQRLAPILLIPVEVRRHSVQEGYRICQADEEPRINITLLEMLAQDFDLRLPNLDPIPEDEHGIDVKGILTTVRQAIKDMRRWDVVEEAQVGFFSFTKFLMWRDLEQRSEDLLKNKVVDHLVNHPNEPFPDDGGFPREDTLDEKYPPQDTFCTLPADSSQLAAVHAAAADKTFVLFGPPGTGKSQTITNLIAHSLAVGKSVLFVSEKMAALNVVYNRLSQSGLGPFCLELHSSKTHKRQVIDRLGQALDFRAGRGSEEWERLARQLAGLRADLNSYVQALHQPRSFGESVFQATSRLIGLRQAVVLDLKLSSPEAIRREQLDRWRDLVDQVRTAGDSCGHAASCAWSTCGDATWSPALQRDLEADIQRLQGLCDRLDSCVQKLGPRLAIGTTWNLSYFEFADKFARFLAQAPRTPARLLQETDWESTESSINEWLAHGRKRDSLRQGLYQRYQTSLLSLDLEGLTQRLQKARASWFLPRLLGLRAVRKNLATTLRTWEKPGAAAMAEDLAQAIALRDEEKRLADVGERARQLLGQYWKEGEADWDAIDAVRDWSGRFREFSLAITGSNFEKAAAIRQRWTPLVTEGYESLRPEGELGQLIADFLAVYAEFSQVKAGVESRLAAGADLWGTEARRVTLADMRAKLSDWQASLPGLRAWCNWRRVRREAVEAGLQPLVTAYESEGLPASQLRSAFDCSFYQWWVESITEKDPVLQQFFSPEHERKIRQFREIDERFTQLTRGEIQARLAAQRPANGGRVSESSEVGILNRQRQLRRGHMPVRQLFQKIPQLLHQLKPCLLMSPISVAQYLDASHPPFDLVVFDEASQIPVWDSVGAIARAKEAIVVGDPKQLPPTNFFMRAEEQEVTDDTLVEEMESILDECLSARLPQMHLRWHYRSRHESLIAFSNHYYYDNNLLTFPSPCSGMGGLVPARGRRIVRQGPLPDQPGGGRGRDPGSAPPTAGPTAVPAEHRHRDLQRGPADARGGSA